MTDTYRDRAEALQSRIDRALALHVETPETGKCEECSAALYSIHSVRWPCPTARILSEGGE